MKRFTGEASRTIDATPAATFDLITDVDRLPEWNAAIEEVIERPAMLAVGDEWTVRMHPPRMPSWGSASLITELDPLGRRFGYDTRNTDGNPSRTVWSWLVEPTDGGGSKVTVRWNCTLATLDRRLFAGPIRKRALAREVPRSLGALAATLTDVRT